MTWTFLIYGLLPLVAFVLVDFYAGPKWGVLAAVVFAVADVGLTYGMSGLIDPAAVVALILIGGLGALTLKLESPLYIKLQPVAMAGIFALIIAYFQFVGGGLVARYQYLLAGAMPPDMGERLNDPVFLATMDRAVTGLIPVFIVHGAWVAFAAYRQGNVAWLLVRGLGFWALFLVYMVIFVIHSALTGPLLGA